MTLLNTWEAQQPDLRLQLFEGMRRHNEQYEPAVLATSHAKMLVRSAPSLCSLANRQTGAQA